MAIQYWKTIELTISAGGSKEDSWTPETNVRIGKIYVIGKGSVDLSLIDLYIEVAGNTKTKAYIPAKVLDPSNQAFPEIDWTITSGSKIYVKATNNDTSDHTIRIVFEVIT